MTKYLVTGSSGFIGFHFTRKLAELDRSVAGVDACTPYYDVRLKEAREEILRGHHGVTLRRDDLADADAVHDVFAAHRPDVVVHLAAQAGVRYSITHPDAYVSSNVVGTYNVLEACRRSPVKHLIIASTSSVYGANETMPFAEVHAADTPLTLYAASKKSTEAMAHSYAHLYGIPTTVARFFTVYGPWGRPDMALFKFVRAIMAGEPIEIFNNGDMSRDFTYIDDLVEALVKLCDVVPSYGGQKVSADDTLSPVAPYRVVNMGGGSPVELGHFVDLVERAVGRAAHRKMLPMQDGDVQRTSSSTALLNELIGECPATPVEIGVPKFVEWYRDHYGTEAEAVRGERVPMRA